MIVIKNVKYIDVDKSIINGPCDVLIDGNRVKKIADKIDEAGAYTIDGSDKLLMPGLFNTHNHIAMSVFRNYADDMELMDWLQNKIWPLESKLTAEDIYWANLLTFIELVKTGTTAFNDMYMFCERVFDAASEVGMRGLIARGMTNDAFNKEREANIRDMYEKYHQKDGLLRLAIAPHAIYTTGLDYLESCIDLAKELDLIIHTHANETLTEVNNSYKEYKKSPIKIFKELGMFDQKTILAHCVHLSEEDMDIIAKSNALVSINVSSNMKLASGIPDIKNMFVRGDKLSIGTDGASSNNMQNMFTEMRAVSLAAKARSLDPKVMSAGEVLKLATINPYKYIFDEDVNISEGSLADLILIDLDNTNLKPQNNLISAMVYSMNGSEVDTTIINGKIIMENKKIKGVDEDLVASKVEEIIKNI